MDSVAFNIPNSLSCSRCMFTLFSGFERNREYIASQGPLPETIFDFWRMAWESETTTIVMVSKSIHLSKHCSQKLMNLLNLVASFIVLI